MAIRRIFLTSWIRNGTGSVEGYTRRGLELAVNVLDSFPPDQMAVAKLVPEIVMLDSFGVRLLDPVEAGDGAEHCEVACDGVMQSREESIHRVHPNPRVDVEARTASARANPARCPGGLECSHDCGSDRDDAASPSMSGIDRVCRCGWNSRLETPVCRMIPEMPTPRASSTSRTRGVMGLAALGISTLPGNLENSV